MPQIKGYCADEFSSVQKLLQEKLDCGEELGASLAVEVDGELVIDLWGGFTDESKAAEWQRDTVVNLWSTTKNVGSLAVLLPVDKGLLNLDDEVSKHWPEFAANGKGGVKVRHIISHTLGVGAWEKPIDLEDIYDVEKSTARLAQQEPWWEPGTATGYHSLTHGHLISELIRRTTGKPLKRFVTDELAKPLGADFQLGLIPEDYQRVATIIPPQSPSGLVQPPAPLPGSVMEKAKDAPAIQPRVANTASWRAAEVGSGNGHGKGRSVAKILSPIALGGTVGGRKYLSPETIDQIFQVQAHGEDLIVGVRLLMGTGFGLPAKNTYWDWAPTDRRICGWGGLGGSMGIVDIHNRMTIGYAMNKMHNVGMGSDCTKAYIAEIYKCLGIHI